MIILDTWEPIFYADIPDSESLWERVRNTKMFALQQQQQYPIKRVLESLRRYKDGKQMSESDRKELENLAKKSAAIASSGCKTCAKLQYEESV